MMNAHRFNLVMEEDRTFQYARPVTDPDAVYQFLTDELKLDKRPEEHFIILSLDTHNKIIGVFDNTCGGASACAISPAEVFRVGLASNATALIIAHNHPSGDPTPSDADDETTARLRAGGEIVSIPVVDHIIVGDHSYYDYMMESSILD